MTALNAMKKAASTQQGSGANLLTGINKHWAVSIEFEGVAFIA
jgi:hypothetical protein